MRNFEEIIVRYNYDDPYPEYKGKPYFSIKYEENGKHHIGYGTYNPQVLSNYIKDYFNDRASLVEELEKIKEEINNIEPGYNFGGFYYCQSKVLDVIDERLAELKGENKQ